MGSATRYPTAGRYPPCRRAGSGVARWRHPTVAGRSTPHPAATTEAPAVQDRDDLVVGTRVVRLNGPSVPGSLRRRGCLPAAGGRPPAGGDQRRCVLAQPGSQPAARRDARQGSGERLARARRLPAIPAPLHPRRHDPVLAVRHTGRTRRDVLLDAAGCHPALAPRSTRNGGHHPEPPGRRPPGIRPFHGHACSAVAASLSRSTCPLRCGPWIRRRWPCGRRRRRGASGWQGC